MNVVTIAAGVNQIIKDVAGFIRQERLIFSSEKVSDKGVNQLVSYVDIEAEKMLVKGLSALVPEAGFITEENTQQEVLDNQALNWIIDPLDGTTNFIHDVPVYSISVALVEGGKPLVGVVYEINRDELFAAWKGGGAWLNGGQIHCSATVNLKQSLLATGFPYYNFEQMEAYLSVLKEFMKETHGLRRLGSAAVDLAYVACGRFEGFFEYGLNAWDVAAGILLVEEAGGKVCDFKGGDDYLFGKEIIAGCAGVHSPMLSIVSAHFKS